MIVYRNINQLVSSKGVHHKDGRRLIPSDLDIIEDGAVVFDEDVIHWVGKTAELPDSFHFAHDYSLKDHCLTPEIVDSHTHAVFGGNRADEYALRLNGANYQEIAKMGGGILSTMKATRSLSVDQLFELACPRVERIASFGVGTLEIKSGYGLERKSERNLSLAIDKLKKHFSPRVQIIRTYMAAHAVPKEYSSSTQYLSELVVPLMKELHDENLIDQVDIFHETGYFSSSDVRLLHAETQKLGLPLKTHADEFDDNGGASLAAELQALSADHLLGIGEKGIAAIANSSTVATLLPGTGLFLGKPQAPARKLLDAGAKLAIASDYNPGSCHFDQLLLLASMMAPQLKLNQAELWAAITYNSAHALGLKGQGAILPGMKPRFSYFKAPNLSAITYHWGHNFSISGP